jgi:Hemerythrin HHE cation binding domain
VIDLAAGPGPPSPRGEALVAELRWVHDMIRRDLALVRQMAADAEAGQPPGVLRGGIASLATASPVWQLKAGCLRHCRFVHSHHTHESALVFPALRRSSPALNPVVDKLEADHAHIARLLDEVGSAARDLGPAAARDGRPRLVAALRTLSSDLLAHLAYEEEQISGTLRTWAHWPGW